MRGEWGFAGASNANPQRKRATVKAIWNGTVIAESNDTVVVDNNHYFPRESLKSEFFRAAESKMSTNCPWKGDAAYLDIVVNGEVNADAAWHYDDPKEAAAELKTRVAFWRGVEVTE